MKGAVVGQECGWVAREIRGGGCRDTGPDRSKWQ